MIQLTENTRLTDEIIIGFGFTNIAPTQYNYKLFSKRTSNGIQVRVLKYDHSIYYIFLDTDPDYFIDKVGVFLNEYRKNNIEELKVLGVTYFE